LSLCCCCFFPLCCTARRWFNQSIHQTRKRIKDHQQCELLWRTAQAKGKHRRNDHILSSFSSRTIEADSKSDRMSSSPRLSFHCHSFIRSRDWNIRFKLCRRSSRLLVDISCLPRWCASFDVFSYFTHPLTT
jgi:hypothetical protein